MKRIGIMGNSQKRIISAVLTVVVIFGTLLCLAGCSEKTGDGKSRVDIDLTKLNNSLAYAKVTEMYKNPKAYVGKTVRVRGGYYPYYAEDLDATINYLTISETCCVQYFDLDWDGDFPENTDDIIEIVGVFESHDDYQGYDTQYRIDVDDLVMM